MIGSPCLNSEGIADLVAWNGIPCYQGIRDQPRRGYRKFRVGILKFEPLFSVIDPYLLCLFEYQILSVFTICFKK
jgi:hypothetical protein